MLQSYRSGAVSTQGSRALLYSSSLNWVGLRPSQLSSGGAFAALPPATFQSVTDYDRKTCDRLSAIDFGKNDDEYKAEIDEWKKKGGVKVELEALNWIGMDFLTDVWLKKCVETGDFI